MTDQKTRTPLSLADLEAVLAEAKLHWPRKPLPPLTAREVDALSEGAKLIPLSKGYWAIFDAEDYQQLSLRYWSIMFSSETNRYAQGTCAGNKKSVFMHRQLLSAPDYVDHKNGDGLDNRRFNLRPATRRENQRNRTVARNSKTGIRGVYPCKNRFCSEIYTENGRVRLGTFDTIESAAQAYSDASRRYHGEFGNPTILSAGRLGGHMEATDFQTMNNLWRQPGKTGTRLDLR